MRASCDLQRHSGPCCRTGGGAVDFCLADSVCSDSIVDIVLKDLIYSCVHEAWDHGCSALRVSQNVSNHLVVHLSTAGVKKMPLGDRVMLCTHQIANIANRFPERELIGHHINESRIHPRHIGGFEGVVIVVRTLEPLQDIADNSSGLANVLRNHL